jgi:hypothetical protein
LVDVTYAHHPVPKAGGCELESLLEDRERC